jgi:hypothetical protein
MKKLQLYLPYITLFKDWKTAAWAPP